MSVPRSTERLLSAGFIIRKVLSRHRRCQLYQLIQFQQRSDNIRAHQLDHSCLQRKVWSTQYLTYICPLVEHFRSSDRTTDTFTSYCRTSKTFRCNHLLSSTAMVRLIPSALVSASYRCLDKSVPRENAPPLCLRHSYLQLTWTSVLSHNLKRYWLFYNKSCIMPDAPKNDRSVSPSRPDTVWKY